MRHHLWAMLPRLGGKMDRINLPFFCELGTNLKSLAEARSDPNDRIRILIGSYSLKENLNVLFQTHPSLTVCRAKGLQLAPMTDALWAWYGAATAEQRASQDSITTYKFHQIVSWATEFQTILMAELQTLAAYHVTEKALFSTTRLVESAASILPQDILGEVPEIKDDINQAGRCLAFDLPTAVGFHTWRAVETVLVRYCEALQAKPKRKDWGSYIAALKSMEADPTTVGILDQIRALHRNPTMHPEIVLSVDEAIGLFGIAPSAIVAMVNDIRRHQTAAKPPPATQ